MKVLLDTNVLLQAIAHRSRLRPIWNAFLTNVFALYVTTDILLEYEEQLAERTSLQVSQSVIALIEKARNAHFILFYFQWNAIAVDPDDNKFFDAAVAAGADYLVTNDAHFNEAKRLPFPKVTIVSADEFLEILEAMRENED